MKRALIIGHTGQDGNYLFDFLNNKGYSIIGIARNKIDSNFQFSHQPVDIKINDEIAALIKLYMPDEIYYEKKEIVCN